MQTSGGGTRADSLADAEGKRAFPNRFSGEQQRFAHIACFEARIQRKDAGAFLLGDGPAVLHTGDADPAADNFTLLRDLPAVDVALVPFWYVLDASGLALVRQALAPRHIVAVHVPPSDAADVARRLAASGMDAVLLTRPGMVVRDGVEVQQ